VTLDLLLLRPNDQKKVYSSVSDLAAIEPPFWAATIAAYARRRGIRVNILDAEVGNLSPNEVIERLQPVQPKVIGIVITGNNLSASTWKMHGAGAIAAHIKERLPQCKIFMWGLHVSALPERTLQEEQTDYVIKGESLRSIAELVKYEVSGEGNLASIRGLYYRMENGEIRGNAQISLEKSLDNIPHPAWDLLAMEQYRAHNWHRFGETDATPKGYGVIATSLGCPYNCSYCAIHTLFGAHRVRFRSVESVLEEINTLVTKYHVHYIKILDENFVLNKKYVEELCDRIIERNYDLNMWAYARVDTVDEHILKKLRKANVRWLCLGIESADENAMNDVNKGQYNNNRVADVVAMIKAADINILGNFMFGLPEDTMESMQKTLELARELNCEWMNMYSTMAFPGSQLYWDSLQNCKDDLPENWLGYSELSYESHPMPTKYLSSKEVLAFRDYAFQAYFENNERYFNLLREKFGENAVKAVKSMLERKMKRKLLEQ